MIYLFIIFVNIVFIILYDVLGYVNYRQVSLIFLSSILICVAGLRFRVGMDTLAYMAIFEAWPRLENLNYELIFGDTKFQPIWVLYVSGIKTFFGDFVYLQFANAIILNVIIIRFFSRYVKLVFTAVLIYSIFYYLEFNFEIMRESLAVAFFLLSLSAFERKHWVSYYFLVAVAYGFHFSALFLLLLPPLRNLKVNVFYMFLLILPLFPMIILYLVSLFSGLQSAIFTFYIETYLDEKLELNLLGWFFVVFSYIVLPLFLLHFLKGADYSSINKFKSLILLTGIIAIGAAQIPILERYNNYLACVYILFVVSAFEHIKFRKQFKREIILVVCSIFIFKFYGFYREYYVLSLDPDKTGIQDKNISRYLPYNSVLSPKLENVREKYFNDQEIEL